MKKISYFLACMMISSVASASEGAWNEHTGRYLEFTGGINAATILVFGAAQGVGWSGAAGYQFTPGFGIEAGLMQNFLSSKEMYTVPIVSTRFIFPLGDRFSFITKLGVMAPISRHHVTGSLYTGVGLSYAITKKVDFTVQYQGAIFGVANAGLAGVGFTYHFG